MKNSFVLLIALSTLTFDSQAQNTWISKASLNNGKRWGAVGFSIGNKGYIGTGYDGTSYKNDFWEYDPITNSWTQKADFVGGARYHATGFSAGNMGYIGTGIYNGILKKDFWQYDPFINSWTQKSDFLGSARFAATGFGLNGKGYLGTGRDGPSENNTSDFYEYDPASDTWTQKVNYSGGNRYLATSFSIGNNGYLGTGWNGSAYQKDFWKYDPMLNSWTQKASFAGTAREGATGVNIGDKGYIGMGHIGNQVVKNDFWEYDPLTNSWTQKPDCGGDPRSYAIGFSIGTNGYIGMGYDYATAHKDLWQYMQQHSVCEVPANLSVINITSSSAMLNWNAVSGALSYKVRYQAKGTSEWIIAKALNNHKTINSLVAGTEYTWQVKSFCEIKPVVSSDWSIDDIFTTAPMKISSEQSTSTFLEIYPNPFSSSTTISFSVHQNSRIQIELLDIAGRKLRILLNENVTAGNYELNLNRDRLSAGIYFLRMKINAGLMVKKMVVE